MIVANRGQKKETRELTEEKNSVNRKSVFSHREGVAPLLWMRLQRQLADLHYKAGREEEAREVEAELSKLLSHADADYPFRTALAER